MTQLLQEEKLQQKTGLGGHYPRIDAVERVTGLAKYGADWKVTDMLYGRIVTSKVPHGLVKYISTSKLTSMSGVKAIISCLDDKTIWHAGEKLHSRRIFTDRVRYVGDCIAAVAATSRTIAQEAVEAIEVDYDELPTVFSIEDAMRKDAPRIWDDGNVFGPIRYGYGSLQACFEKADFTVERDYETTRVYNAQLEPAVSLAWWEDDKLTVVASAHSIFGVRDFLAKDLGIPVDRIRVISLYKGGGFGGKSDGMIYDTIAALLAKKARKPVMIEYSRMDDFVGTHSRFPTRQHLYAAVRRSDAKLLAIDLKAQCDVGSYNRNTPPNPMVGGPENCYSSEAWKAEIYQIYTNTPPTGAMRAPRSPHSCFAAESFVDEIAYSLSVNPLDFRLRNSVIKYHNEASFASNGLKECILSGAEKFGWKERWHLPPKDISQSRDVKMSGVGVAIASLQSLVTPSGAIVKIGRDGILEVRVGIVDIGTGAKTTMAIIAANTLGVALEDVRVIWGDTATTPYSQNEAGSKATGSTGRAVGAAAEKLKTKILQIASASFGAVPIDLVIEDGFVKTKDGRQSKIGDIIKISGVDSIEEKEVTELVLPKNIERMSFMAHFAEVEVDLETGQIRVSKYVAAHDSGQIVNRLTAENQVQGGVIMGLGMSLTERVLISKDYGSIENPSFLTYRLPNITMAPRVEVIFADVDDPYGPKSLGEAPCIPVPAAVGNAIFNATGKRLRKLPFLPEYLLAAVGTISLNTNLQN